MERRSEKPLPQSILVIDDDRLLNNQLVSLLLSNGMARVDAAFDGESGWRQCLETNYDLLILDWKLPVLSGLALFNRIRGVERLMGIPVLVVSGFVQEMDFRLLQEFPCTHLLEKPFNHAAMLRQIDALHAEGIWYTKNSEIISEVMATVTADPDEAVKAIRRIAVDSPNPHPVTLLAARKMREAEHLDQAISLLKFILDDDRGCVPAISELGRCLHLLGRFDEALQFLRRANGMAPANIQRLSLMGEVELNKSDAEAAKERFGEALKVDQENKRARQGLKVAGTLAEMMSRPARVHMKDTFATLMNTMAVNLAHNGEYSSAVVKYEEAFHFIAGKEASARVAFNIGLAYLRWGKTRESYDWFQESAKRGKGKFAKAEVYVEKLEVQMKKEAATELAANLAAKEARATAAAAAADESAKEAKRLADEEAKKAAEAAKVPQHEQPK